MSGDLDGEVSSLALNDFSILFDEQNSIHGRLRLFGLPLIDETFIDLILTKSYIDTKDIIGFFKPKTQELLGQFRHTSFTGKFLGFLNDFVANGDFNTDLGQIKSNINLKLFII